MSMNRKELKGFTVMEMMVVVAILGILSAMVAPQYGRIINRAKVSEAARSFDSALRVAKHTARTSGRTMMLCPVGNIKVADTDLVCLDNWLEFNTTEDNNALGWITYQPVGLSDTDKTKIKKVLKKYPVSKDGPLKMAWNGETPLEIKTKGVPGFGGTMVIQIPCGSKYCTTKVVLDALGNTKLKRTMEKDELTNKK